MRTITALRQGPSCSQPSCPPPLPMRSLTICSSRGSLQDRPAAAWDVGGALSGKSMMSGSTGNVACVLQFCIKNNYLDGNSASSVKDRVMGKLSGKPSYDKGYNEGEKGILSSSDGKKLDLSGGGLKAKVTRQVCDQILAQGKSLL
jgi:hypothetical protein